PDGGAKGSIAREAQLALEISLKIRDLLKQELPDLNVLMTRDADLLPGNSSSINAALKYRADFANRSGGDLFISVHLNASLANQRYGRRQIGTREETYYVYSGKGKKRKKIAKQRTVPVYERYRLPATVKGTQTYILASDYYNQKIRSVGQKSEIYEGGENDSLDQEMLAVDPVEARIRAAQYTRYFFQKSLTLATMVEEEFSGIGRYSWGVQQRDWQGIWILQATQMPSILIETGFIDNPDEEAYLASEAGQKEMARAVVNAIKRYKALLENPEKAGAAGRK
ncbi:MAG: N-acetylmuramoyl-L-alanine amidase, partial [Chitinophagaceae bacterium]|nr:N-acetylmuramoyl-L-alanine amidase [Chitinophagaceae bacterium]